MVIMARSLPIFQLAKEAVKMIKWQISSSLTHFLSSSISSWVLPLLLRPLLLTNVHIYLAKARKRIMLA